MLNIFEKNITSSLNLISENNIDIFQNPFLFDTNKLLTDKDYSFESSFPLQNDKKDFNQTLCKINKDNLNLPNPKPNILVKQEKPNINYKFYVEKVLPNVLYENDIIKIINNKMNISHKIKNILNSISNIKDDSRIEIVKKDITEKLNTRSKRLNKKLKNKEDIKYGRKKKEDSSIGVHNKYASDNIIIKIKNIIKKYLINFINNIIISLYGSKKINEIRTILNLPKHVSLSLIKDISYKSIANKTKKKDNLDLLNFSIEEFLSCNVSKRYKKINKKEKEKLSEYNKIIIDFLLKDDENKELYNFIFKDLKLEDFLNIFIYQKELNYFTQFNFLEEEQKKIIEASFIRIDDFFDKLNEEGLVYFFCFLLLIFNYKRYFLIKQERIKRNKINKSKEKIKFTKIKIFIDDKE